MMKKVQRKDALRIASAYCTVALEAIRVISGTIPIHLLAEERARLHHLGEQSVAQKTAKRQRTIRKWQQHWESHMDTEQWTKKLMPRIEPWLNFKHRKVDYFLTQAMTGHGSFKTYTFRIGKSQDEACEYCGEKDTPAHTIFTCERWGVDRQELKLEFGTAVQEERMV